MVNWIAGNWSYKHGIRPWSASSATDGVFEPAPMGYATEELWFTEVEKSGGPRVAKEIQLEKFNPANHVDKVGALPMLVIHGQQDFPHPGRAGHRRLPSLRLQRQGRMESKFLYFPDENHWVLNAAELRAVARHGTNGWGSKHIGQARPRRKSWGAGTRGSVAPAGLIWLNGERRPGVDTLDARAAFQGELWRRQFPKQESTGPVASSRIRATWKDFSRSPGRLPRRSCHPSRIKACCSELGEPPRTRPAHGPSAAHVFRDLSASEWEGRAGRLARAMIAREE
jgi:hypothetical protein